MNSRTGPVLLSGLLALAAVAGCVRLDAAGPPGGVPPCTLGLRDFPSGPGPLPGGGGGGSVTIKTDSYGVSHVYADDLRGLAYGNGWVQARDRLFQMDLLRHIAFGDSASIVGASQLESDLQVRRDLYTRGEVRAQLAAAPPWVHEALEAYSDGVNARMAEDAAQGALPAEFAALAHAPEPWTPEDTVGIGAYLLAVYGVGGGSEIRNARMLAALHRSLGSLEAAYEALGDLNPLVTSRGHPSIAADEKRVAGCEDVLPFDRVPPAQLELALRAAQASEFGAQEELALQAPAAHRGRGILEGFSWGSNALLVAGSRSATGLPVMFGGPQVGYNKPPVLYEIGLHGAGFDVTGVGIAGAPGIVIGRTGAYAWTVTSGYEDQVDTVVLETDPGDPSRFRWGSAWEPMECRAETHRVAASASRGEAPRVVAQEVCRARGMPIVARSPAEHLAWGVRSATRGEELQALATWIGLPLARDLPEFRARLADFPFSFNFHYAGPDGIGFYHLGTAPLRDPGLDPRLPGLPGDSHAWRGEAVGLGLGTWIENPASGYVVNWNNAPALGWRKGDQMNAWDGIHRVALLDGFAREAFAAGPVGWREALAILKAAATHDPFAPHSAPAFAAAARSSGDPALAPLADALEAWGADGYPWLDADADDAYDHPGHAVWDATRVALQPRLLGDELGDETPGLVFDPALAGGSPNQADHGSGFTKDAILVDALSGRTRRAWCDDVRTPAPESCEEVLVAALREARGTLVERFGNDPAAWLEPVHHNRFQPIGASRVVEIPMVNRGSWNQVVAIGQGLAGAGGILPPGQSGRVTVLDFAGGLAPGGSEPGSLTSQLEAYVAFELKPLPVTPAEVDGVAVSVETIPVPPARPVAPAASCAASGCAGVSPATLGTLAG